MSDFQINDTVQTKLERLPGVPLYFGRVVATKKNSVKIRLELYNPGSLVQDAARIVEAAPSELTLLARPIIRGVA